jgi:hypothetical protein
MKILSSRDFRLLVLDVEGALKTNHYLRIVNIAHGIELGHTEQAASIDIAINKIIHNRSGDLTFEQTQASRLCKSFELRQKLAKYRPSLRLQLRSKKRIRKQQEDAPVQGAESNLSGAC